MLVLTLLLSELLMGALAADTITVDATSAASFGHGVVRSDFASLSYEVSCVPTMFTHAGGPRTSFVGLMKQLQAVNGKAGVNVRIGGNSADESAYVPQGALPDGATYRITDADFSAYLAAAPLWNGSITPGLNFRAGSNASLEVAHATALAKAIPWQSGLVEALEIGNECDLYPTNGYRAKTWGANDYAKEAGAVMEKLANSGVPSNRIQGATFCCHKFDSVIPAYLDANKNKIRTLSYHEYPLNVCSKQTNTIWELLSTDRIVTPIKDIAGIIAETKARGIPFYIGEGNSVACGGEVNVSDVFASALWAVDTLFAHAEAGVDRWNFHGCNRGACETRGCTRSASVTSHFHHPPPPPPPSISSRSRHGNCVRDADRRRS